MANISKDVKISSCTHSPKDIMRRPQNLKKSPTGFDKTAVFTKYLASKQVGDFFKFLWPFQKSWTLKLCSNMAFLSVVLLDDCKVQIL